MGVGDVGVAVGAVGVGDGDGDVGKVGTVGIGGAEGGGAAGASLPEHARRRRRANDELRSIAADRAFGSWGNGGKNDARAVSVERRIPRTARVAGRESDTRDPIRS